MKIIKDKNNLIVTIPLKQRRWNPYEDMATGNGDVGEMDNLIGVVMGNDIGFCQLIDMDYKGKPDQIGDFIVKWFGEEEDFRKLCKELEIDFHKYPLCDNCFEPILGSFTCNDKGKCCYSCQWKFEDEKKLKSK